MCGLFGMVRAEWPGSVQPCRWATAMITLGVLAEARGVDSAGIAVLPGARRTGPDVEPTVLRTLGPFSALVGDVPINGLAEAWAVIGHTRWATQGAVTLRNASPIQVSSVIGAHNGDLDFGAHPGTDSEILLELLAEAAPTASAVRTILAAAVGRAALAWVDSRRPGVAWLARAGLSPLAVARTPDGGLVWASNPQWLREVERLHQLGLSPPRMLREGTILRVAPREGRVVVRRAAPFRPAVRAVDLRLTDELGWRDLSASDRAVAGARQRHRLVERA